MFKITALILILICGCTQVSGQNLSENSTGSFIFTPQAPLNRPPVEVFYHIPSGDITTMPILMSFHGANRDGDNHRDYWINMANANGFMVFAPEFTTANYPGLGDNYIMSNIFDDGDNPTPESFNDQNEWTCSILEPLFDYLVADISGTQETYNAWGHSAGAQFLHRLFMYLPNNKIDIAVCSNAGWYTVPETMENYPYGILNGELPNNDLISAFSKSLIIHLGEDDTIPSTSPGGPRDNSTVNNQQGLTRLDRGRYFFATSETTAQNLAVAFNWEKYEVPNVGHDPQLMANDALPYILMNSLSSEGGFGLKEAINLYPNPISSGFVTISTLQKEPIAIEIYDVLGKKINTMTLVSDRLLSIANLKAGVYFLKMTQNQKSTTKKLIIN